MPSYEDIPRYKYRQHLEIETQKRLDKIDKLDVYENYDICILTFIDWCNTAYRYKKIIRNEWEKGI